jgi:membrane protease YdiL (CAAX protease family)
MELIPEKQKKPDERMFIETLIILGLVVILSFLLPQIKGNFEMIPIAYILVERHLRKRSFEEIGFKLKSTLKDVKDNWHLTLLVAVVTQLLTLLIAKILLPDFTSHVQSRIPMLNLSQLIPLLIMITIGTFAEEIVYRGFFQERLGWFLGTTLSIIISSAIFSFMHYSSGSFIVVAYDIFTIFIDSLIYSAIYHRTKNIFASWIPHYLADIFGVIAMFLLF